MIMLPLALGTAAGAAELASVVLQDIWGQPSRRASQRHENSDRGQSRSGQSGGIYRTVRKLRRVQER
jgi:hypothetical protein